jgi:hypothetical protein
MDLRVEISTFSAAILMEAAEGKIDEKDFFEAMLFNGGGVGKFGKDVDIYQ